MPTVSELDVVITANTAGFDAGVKHVQESAGGMRAAIEQGIGMGAGFGIVQQGLELVSGAFELAKGSVIDLNSSLEQSRIAFTTMLGSGEKADAFLTDLQKFAATTPFEFPDLVEASKRLLAMGTAADQVRPMMTAIGNAVAAVGGGKEEINGITMALGQMQAKGKVSAEEMNQLAERGIPAWDMLAQKLGVDIPTAMKMASQGAVSASTFMQAFEEGTAARFGNMMDAQSRTFVGAMSNITDSLNMATAKAFKPFFDLVSQGALVIADFLQGDAFANWADGVATAVTDLFAALKPLVTDGFRQLGDAVRTVQQVLAGDWAPSDEIDPFVNALGIMTVAFRDDVLPALKAFADFLNTYVMPAVSTVATFILQQMGTVLAWFQTNFPQIAQVFGEVVALIETIWSQHGETIVTVIRDAWTIVSTVFETALKNLLDLLTIALDLLTGNWSGAWDTLVSMTVRNMHAWATVFGAGLDILFALLDDATGGMLTTITTWLTDTAATIERGWGVMADGMAAAWTGAQGIVAAWDAAWGSMAQTAVDTINGTGTGIVDVVSTGWTAVSTATGNAFNAAGTGIVAVAQTGWTAVKTATDTAFRAGTADSILNAASKGWTAVVNATSSLLTGTGDTTLSGVVSKAWDAITSYISGLAASGSALLQAALDVGTGIVTSIKDGISSEIAAFQDWFKWTFTDKIPQWARDVLGIHSPSGVFYDIGVQLVEGLRQGIASKMPSIEDIVAKAVGMLGGGDVPGELDDWLNAAIAITGVGSDWLGGMRWLAMHESTGNPHAVNPQGVGGQHASGLMQMMPSTFRAYRDASLPNDIFNPIANAVASIAYIKDTYGSIGRVISGWADRGGYAGGGWAGLHGPELAWLGERGPEYVIPNAALGGMAAGPVQHVVVDVAIGGRIAEQIYVEGRDLAIRRGRVPAGAA